MPDSNPNTASIRPLWIMAGLVWLLISATALLYLFFVFTDHWRPHIAWWLVTSTIVVIAILGVVGLVLRQFWRRQRILQSMVVLMLTVTPLVWLGSFIWSAAATAHARGDLRLSSPIKAVAVWVGNWFEIEGRWRHPRVTEGRHVELFDDGDIENVEQLVADMDAHIEQMCEVLEQPLPKWKTAWVRGSLFGFHGRAIGLWAICNRDTEDSDLTGLDRHEVAHTTITGLCTLEQYPPTVLSEGWAQSQSNDREQLIKEYFDYKTSGMIYSFDEMISDRFYGRSTGPAYNHGGAMAVYLLERFGGKRFHELYGQVRRESFEEDVQRILDTSWQQLELDFANWHDQEVEALLGEQSHDPPDWITFHNPEDKELWVQIEVSARNWIAENGTRPEEAAFEMDQSNDFRIRAVYEGESAWVIADYPDGSMATEYTLRRPEQAAPNVRVCHNKCSSAWGANSLRRYGETFRTKNDQNRCIGASHLTAHIGPGGL